MRILVLGGTSFTGPHAVRELVERGHEVTVFHRGKHEVDLPGAVRHMHGDVSDFEGFLPEFRRLQPDVVVDMLAFLPHEGRRIHALKGIGTRGVVVSSADVYRAFGRIWRTEPGPPEPVPLREDSPLREVVIDDRYDKVGVEREACSDADVPVTVLRYPAVYGPGDPQHRLYEYIRRMDDGRPAILLETTHASWRWVRGYSENVAHALALAVESDRSGVHIYNVASPVAHREEDWVRKIADVVGWEGRIVAARRDTLPEAMREDVDLTQDYVVDSSRIRAELGYGEVVEELTGLERTVSWERAKPPTEFQLDYDAEDAALASLG